MTVEIGSITGEVIDIPVAVHDWGESGARWTAHPSLSQKLKGIIVAVDPYMKSNDLNSRFVTPLGDCMIYGSKSPDNNCLDSRAAKRGAFKLKLAIIPKDSLTKADAAPQSLSDAVFERLTSLEVGKHPGNGKHLQFSLNMSTAFIVGLVAREVASSSLGSFCMDASSMAQCSGTVQVNPKTAGRNSFQTEVAHNLNPGWTRTHLISPTPGKSTAKNDRSLTDQHSGTASWLRRKILFPLLTYVIVAILVLLLQSIWGLAKTSVNNLLSPPKTTSVQGTPHALLTENIQRLDASSNAQWIY